MAQLLFSSGGPAGRQRCPAGGACQHVWWGKESCCAACSERADSTAAWHVGRRLWGAQLTRHRLPRTPLGPTWDPCIWGHVPFLTQHLFFFCCLLLRWAQRSISSRDGTLAFGAVFCSSVPFLLLACACFCVGPETYLQPSWGPCIWGCVLPSSP